MKKCIPTSKKIIFGLIALALVFGLSGCQVFYPPKEEDSRSEEPDRTEDEKLEVTEHEDQIVAYQPEDSEADTEDAIAVEEGDITLGQIESDQAELEALQEKVNNGEERWRVDPEQVLIAEKEEYGFFPKDQFSFIQKTPGADGSEWLVYAVGHGEEAYLVILGPAFPDQEDSIWIWREIQPNE